MKKFLSRLNPRLLLIHFVAAWFFVYAFRTLIYLSDIDLVDRIYKESRIDDVAMERFMDIALMSSYFGLIGLLIAFFISLFLSYRNKLHWQNPLIVFIISFVLLRFSVKIFSYLGYVFTQPGRLVDSPSLKLIMNGSTVLLLGCLLFFNKRIIRFIAAGEASNQQ